MTNVGRLVESVESAAPVAGRRRTVLRASSSRLLVFALVGLVAACGPGLRAPTERLASSEAAIRSAKALDAQGDERTALLVQLAEEEVAIARNRMQEGENRRADLALQRAESDAALAMMLIREKVATAAARKARAHLEAKTAVTE